MMAVLVGPGLISQRSYVVDFIAIVVTVCALAEPNRCEEQRLEFSSQFSLAQCAANAQPYLAQWLAEHPKWSIKSYHCEYPHMKDRTDTPGSAREA
jgi:hypothetical protein